MNHKVDQFLLETKKWHDELTQLRQIVLDCGLKEEFKWKQPCYSHNNKNILILGAFKDYCTISFFKGVLLKDNEGILFKHGENSQTTRSIKFTDARQIFKSEQLIKAYIFEAVEVEKSGVKVEMKKTEDYEIPDELQIKFSEDPDMEKAFKKLTPGRQRAYLMHFAQAKQSMTRTARIEKYKNRIHIGKGINDCVCGHSKRMPNCDGSHKLFK